MISIEDELIMAWECLSKASIHLAANGLSINHRKRRTVSAAIALIKTVIDQKTKC